MFFINKTPSYVLNGKTPFEFIIGKKPSYHMFKSFGCYVYASMFNSSNKFSPRALECVFFGYVEHKKAYKLLDLRTNKLFFEEMLQFVKKCFFSS